MRNLDVSEIHGLTAPNLGLRVPFTDAALKTGAQEKPVVFT